MFAVVEWFEEDGRKEHTCMTHTQDRDKAGKERQELAFPAVMIDKAFTYEVIEFEDGEACPMCKRNFQF